MNWDLILLFSEVIQLSSAAINSLNAKIISPRISLRGLGRGFLHNVQFACGILHTAGAQHVFSVCIYTSNNLGRLPLFPMGGGLMLRNGLFDSTPLNYAEKKGVAGNVY